MTRHPIRQLPPGPSPDPAWSAIVLIVAFCLHAVPLRGQDASQASRMIIPLQEYVGIRPIVGGHSRKDAVPVAKAAVNQLAVYFNRDMLPREAGPQFIRINVSILNSEGILLDEVNQYAFTFPAEETPEEDARQMEDYAREILQFGFISKGRSDSVEIRLDTLPSWGYLRVEVLPDEEYTKYTTRKTARLIWHYRLRGSWLDSRVTLGIPKVLFDSESQDSIEYGNASALLRFFYINQNTGEQFPVSLGFGLYGVSTPIDVSRRGGGFVLSLYFDIIQLLRVNGVAITDKANAGLEIAPFFPVDHKARVLLSARIGYTP